MLASTVTAALLHLVDCAEAGSPRPVSGDVAINLWIPAGLCTTGYLGGGVAGGRRPHRERSRRPGSRGAVASATPAPDAGREAGRRRGRAARRERRCRRPRRG